MKKLLSIAAAVMVMAISATPALACGPHREGAGILSYSVCTTQSCTLAGLHTHTDKTYAAHYYGDGHNYHAYCDIQDCALTGYHSHDGVYCFGHTANDGHDYHHSDRGHH